MDVALELKHTGRENSKKFTINGVRKTQFLYLLFKKPEYE